MKESIKSGDRYIPCILSRLADDEPQSRIDSMPRVVPLEKIKQEILLNINQILNSRSRPSPADMDYLPEVSSSVLCFGLSDFCGLTKSIETVEKIKNEIICQIKYFEPRVDADSVVVEYQDESFDKSTGFVFEICAQFSLKALSGKFVCISYLDLETGMATVRIKE